MRCGTSLRPHLMNLEVGRQPVCVCLGAPASREGSCQWRSHGHGGGSTGRRPGDHGTQRPDGSPQVAPFSAQGQLPITNCWARNQGQSRCRIAKPETSHNAEPQTRGSHDAESQNPGPPHAGRPRIHMSQAQAGPQSVEPAPRSQSSRLSDSPRAWCSSHTGWTIFTPEDLVICQRQVSVSQTPTPSLYSRMCSKTLAPIFWETS